MRARLPILACALACTLSSAASAAGVPTVITEFGRLLTNSGQPVTTSTNLTFAIYSAATGGTPLWSETQTGVAFDDGYFAVQLGSVVPFPSGLWDGATKYLGVTVGSDSEMTPREVINSVPYALVVNNVTGDLHANSLTIGGVPIVDTGGNLLVGSQGPTGPLGPTGPVGPTGGPGPAGATGAIGVVGGPGPTGGVGPTGTTVAPTGTVGPGGARGPTGPLGPTGAAGPSGPVGLLGPTGPVGQPANLIMSSNRTPNTSATPLGTSSNPQTILATGSLTPPAPTGFVLVRGTGSCQVNAAPGTAAWAIIDVSSTINLTSTYTVVSLNDIADPPYAIFSHEAAFPITTASTQTFYLAGYMPNAASGAMGCYGNLTILYGTGSLP